MNKVMKKIFALTLIVGLFLCMSGIASAVGIGRNYWKTQSTSGNPANVQTVSATTNSRVGGVRAVQQILKMQGLLNGQVDGAFGNNTRSAVIAYQARYGLSSDGVVGNMSWQKMKSQTYMETSNAPYYTSHSLKQGYVLNVSFAGKLDQRFRHNGSSAGGVLYAWYVIWGNTGAMRNTSVKFSV